MQVVTQTLLDLGVDEAGQINESQMLLLDIRDQEKDAFRSLALGKELSDARAELFVLLKNIADLSVREQIIENYKKLQFFRKEPQNIQSQPIQQTVSQETSGDFIIYCDGGCTPNPGQAGSGVSIYKNGLLYELWYGLYAVMGTNNTAELGALYESLKLAKTASEKGNSVTIKCDSMYAINCIKTWACSWEKKGWTKKGGAIKNLEIIKLAYALYNSIKKDVVLSHIKAHAGFEGNELADRMTMYTIEMQEEAFVKYDKAIDIPALLKMRSG